MFKNENGVVTSTISRKEFNASKSEKFVEDISIQGKEFHLRDGDGISFTKGAKLKYEDLDGYSDLRGLQITAYDKEGNVVFSGSVPDTSDNRGFTHFEIDGWVIEQEQ